MFSSIFMSKWQVGREISRSSENLPNVAHNYSASWEVRTRHVLQQFLQLDRKQEDSYRSLHTIKYIKLCCSNNGLKL